MDALTEASTESRDASSLLRRWRDRLADFAWPPVCAHCRAATATPDGLCASCWSRLSFIERPFCERLGTPFAIDIGGTLLSPQAIASPPTFARARAVARYDEVASALVHRHKYADQTHLALTLAPMMVRAGAELITEADVILPTPAHRIRLWTRRYNQAALLARAVADRTRKPLLLDALVRRKHTPPQVGLTRAERAANMSGAFRVPPGRKPLLEGRRLLLIDDVLTTGATANAATGALLRAGAAAVDVLTFARVVNEA